MDQLTLSAPKGSGADWPSGSGRSFHILSPFSVVTGLVEMILAAYK